MVQLPEEDLASLWKILDLDINCSPGQATTKEQNSGLVSPLILQASAALIWQLCRSSLCNKAKQYPGHVPLPSAEYSKAIFDALSGPRMMRLDCTNATINASAIELVLQISLRIAPALSSSPSQSHEYSKQHMVHVFVGRCFNELARVKGFQRYGMLAALAKVFFLVGSATPEDLRISDGTLSPVQENIIALLVRETAKDNLIELREFSLLLLCDFLESDLCTPAMLKALGECLSDYTMDRLKGDVGSHMRIAAAHAADLAISRPMIHNFTQRIDIVAKICGLAVEKLDRVRDRAFGCLKNNWAACGLTGAAELYVDAYIL